MLSKHFDFDLVDNVYERCWRMSWKVDGDDGETSTDTTSTTVTDIRRGRGRPRKSPGSKPQPKIGAAWNTTDPDFDETLFYTRATDPTGLVGHTLHIKVPPDVAAMMGKIVESKSHPAFDTKANIVRHYLVVGLHEYSEKEKDPTFAALFQNMLRDVTAAQRDSTYLAEFDRFKGHLDSLAKMAKIAHEFHDYSGFRTRLNDYWDSLDSYREPMQSQLRAKLEEYEAKILAAASGE